MRWATGSLVLAVAVLAGCATPGHVRRVEARVAMLTVEQARADSAHAAALAELKDMMSRLIAHHQASTSSIMLTLDTLKRNDRTFAAGLQTQAEQLAAMGERLGQTQAVLNRYQSRVDENFQALLAGGGGEGGAPATELPSSLFDQANLSADGKAFTTARATYWRLIQTTTDSTWIARALFAIGSRTFYPDTPDSANAYFNRVVREFPRSPEAPEALYKMAFLAEAQPDVRTACTLYRQIDTQYPSAEVAVLARGKIGAGKLCPPS